MHLRVNSLKAAKDSGANEEINTKGDEAKGEDGSSKVACGFCKKRDRFTNSSHVNV